MIGDAEILISVRNDLKGNPEQYNCKWQGPKNGVVTMSYEFIRQASPALISPVGDLPAIGDVIQVGPYRLKVFAYDEMAFRDVFYLVRQDSLFGNLRATTYRLTRWLDLAYRRLIITAAVWNLAHYHPSQIPSWKDLYIAKRLRFK